MIFSYKAKNKEGQMFEGLLEATDKFALYHDLKSKGNTPISISPQKENASMKIFDAINGFMSGMGVQDQIFFAKNLSSMIDAGLSLSRAISVLKKQTKNKKHLEIFTGLENEINGGGSFSSGLSKFPKVFSNLFVSMVKAGEESGNLSGALKEVAANLEKSHSLTKKIKGALMYPGVILSAMIVIGILMFAFVVPTLAKSFRDIGAKLPATTKVILGLGDFFSNNLFLVFGILIVLVVGFYFLFKSAFMARWIDFVILKIPVIKDITMELNTARIARTVSSLLLSGVPITRAIDIAEDVVQNIYYKKVLEGAKGTIEKGMPFSEVFVSNPKLFPVMMSEMVQVGEETGKLADMLLQVALFFEEAIENRTKNLSTIIEPVLMVIIGVVVGFFAISMISPMYSVMNNIK